jgi:hypothetical protein
MFGSVFGTKKLDVWVNIYDLQENQSMLNSLGVGTHHSGVQVGNYEYYFGMAGVNRGPARHEAFGTFKERVSFGQVEGQVKVNEALGKLRTAWAGDTYNLAHKNCNHFSEIFVKALFPTSTVELPAWLNRAARMGSWFYPSNPNPASDPIGANGTSKNGDIVQFGDTSQTLESKSGRGGVATAPKAAVEAAGPATKKSGMTDAQKAALAKLKGGSKKHPKS